MRPTPILVEFSDGKKALIPFSTQTTWRGLYNHIISSPGGTFGGWIAAVKMDLPHVSLLVDYITERHANLYWRLNPYDDNVFKAGLTNTIIDATHALNLSGGFDVIYRSWTKGHASAERKARKAGVSVKNGITIVEWKDYYQVYQDSLLRWGDMASSSYKWEIFEEMFQRESPNIKLWLADYEGKVVAGALCFYAKKHVVYWHGAALKQYFNLRPVNLLICEIIKDACEKGYNWFDFNPSGGHAGVSDFKKSFGAMSLPSPVIVKQRIELKLMSKINPLLRKVLG